MSDTRLREAPATEYFPSGDEYEKLLTKKQRRALMVRVILLAALASAVLALITLIYTIIDDSFGMVAQVNQVEPEEIVASQGYDPATTGLSDLSKDELVEVLAGGDARTVVPGGLVGPWGVEVVPGAEGDRVFGRDCHQLAGTLDLLAHRKSG